MMKIFKEFHFEAAHWLPNVPNDHKCNGLHGHSYLVRVEVAGLVGDHTGWVMDYAELSEAWKRLHKKLDHSCLNEIQGLENSTSENLAIWIWGQLDVEGLVSVEVRETPSAGCIYTGEDD